jgi:hypothetical protein
MAAIGRCLLFHFKYWNEMDQLYWKAEGSLEGLEDVETTLEMVQAVGNESMREAANLLELCGNSISEYFNTVARCQGMSTRNKIEKNWSVAFNVYPKIKPGTPRLLAGVTIPQDGKAEILAWLRSNNGKAGEQKMAEYLQQRVKGRSEDFGLPSGTILLEKIPIIDGADSADVDSVALVEKIRLAFSCITKPDCSYLYQM